MRKLWKRVQLQKRCDPGSSPAFYNASHFPLPKYPRHAHAQVMRHLRSLLWIVVLMLVTAPALVAEGEDREIRIAVSDSDLELNPLYAYVVTEAQVLTGLHEGLVSYNPLTLDPVPGIARDWSMSDNERTYTFDLRGDARYSNGDTVTAEHVKATWLALLGLGDDAPYAGLFDIIEGAREFRRGDNNDPESVGIRANDEQTLEVELRQPAGHFIEMIAHHSFGVLHPDMIDRRDHKNPEEFIGNGPFILSEAGTEEITLEKNPEYWAQSAVESDRIIFKRFADNREATDEYFSGNIDWNAGPIAFEMISDDRHLVVNSMFGTTFYYIRAEEEPWDDRRVRRALALLLPWEEIRDEDAYFATTERLVPRIAGYPDVAGLTEQNRDEALELLEEAGFPDGEGLPDPLIRIPGGADAERISGLMAEAWETIDLNSEIETVPYPEYFEAAGAPEVTVGQFSWIGDYSDPLTFLQLFVSDSNLNEAGYSDPDYDALIEDAIPLDGEERYERMAEAEQMLLESGTVMPLSHSAAFNLIELDSVEGWFPNALDIHPLRYLRRAPDEPAPDLIRYHHNSGPSHPEG